MLKMTVPELKKVFVALLKDVVKQIINTCYHMIIKNSNKYTSYLDANKIYGLAMRRYLPYDGLKWLNQKEID